MAWRQPPCAAFPALSWAPLVPEVLAHAKLTTRPRPRTPSRQAVAAGCAWIACSKARNLPPVILWSAKGCSCTVSGHRSLTGIGSLRANFGAAPAKGGAGGKADAPRQAQLADLLHQRAGYLSDVAHPAVIAALRGRLPPRGHPSPGQLPALPSTPGR